LQYSKHQKLSNLGGMAKVATLWVALAIAATVNARMTMRRSTSDDASGGA
jgi:hypothetical protein